MVNKLIFIHRKSHGKLQICPTVPIETQSDLSKHYTPGVAKLVKAISVSPQKALRLTIKSHTVAVVTDGSAILGFGNQGALAALPVMEGKAILFKRFANLDAFPVCLDTQDTNQIIQTIRNIAPVFGAINLEDIAAPRCFEIEDKLQDLGIPVMHDDQHGTSVVVLAGLINGAKVVNKRLDELKVVINGAGAAGQAIARLLILKGMQVVILDSKGIISQKRLDLDEYKKRLLNLTNLENIQGGLEQALVNADVFIGVSKANILNPLLINKMNHKPIIFALANPIPEIDPVVALKAGAYIVATGRSDYPNQVNNLLAFPGIFKGAMMAKAERITDQMKIAAAQAIASLVSNPTRFKIVPDPFDAQLVEYVSKAVAGAL